MTALVGRAGGVRVIAPARRNGSGAGAGALSFEVLGVRAEPYAAVPTLMLRLRIATAGTGPVHALALRCQIRIEPQRREYAADEEDRLYEMFGETPQWGNSLRPFPWTHVSTTVPGFSGVTEVDLPLTCTYDFEVAAAKYLHALDGGEVGLLLLFSGTAFTKGDASANADTDANSGFSAQPVPWDEEARFRLPVQVWRDVMDLYFPGGGWVRLRRETIDALQRYKAEHGLPTWDEALTRLLSGRNAR